MKLYYSKGACSLAVRIIINEIGLDCEYESVNLKTKKTEKNEDYLAINPKGAVPSLELDKKEILTENVVIQQYLVDKFKATNLCPEIGDFHRYHVLAWSNYISTELHKTFGNLFNPAITSEMRENIFIPAIRKKLGYVDKQLSKTNFIAGDHFTMADAYLFVMLLWASQMNIDIKEFTHLSRYFAELNKRSAVIKSLKEESLDMAA
ncbi:glutathione transferase GstA [Legionella micdadei]|uniref:Glutathione S-transferase n=1 Tax=Legionella micdadei TaxID=451 RepID=A0A098GDD5_LEGMI|nr:glutathione transferase GstA [Legionella micdadei]ARG97879.1 glutathione S-transferase [Legionella micdadei]ARG99801.1 glutathione S-transferase [Legionella micdadei]KTD28599.1 glutathione S-transferase [Legionella micdadei]NSL19190.1 glutathione transferase GstA [Legionella micdadei]CEG60508.1 Glutathione S-transferase GST-6.0 [Legionella micdadei]